MLEISAELFNAMIAHARQELPAECCGLLAGHNSRAHQLFPLRNELNSPIAYNADPCDLFAAQRAMRQNGLDLVAIYHSHPTSQALPSRRDLAENYYGQIPRIIISLREREPIVKAFVLFDDRFEEIPWSPLFRN